MEADQNHKPELEKFANFSLEYVSSTTALVTIDTYECNVKVMWKQHESDTKKILTEEFWFLAYQIFCR